MTEAPKPLPENKPNAALMAKARENWIKAGHDPAVFDAAMTSRAATGSDPQLRVVGGQVQRA